MARFKRELVPGSYFTAADMLEALAQLQLAAAALGSARAILLAAEPAMAWLLDRCCIGTPLEGRDAEPLLAAVAGSSSGEPAAGSSAGLERALALVSSVAGVNAPDHALQQRYEQHQQQLEAGRQRRARRAAARQARVAASTAPAAEQGRAGAEEPVAAACGLAEPQAGSSAAAAAVAAADPPQQASQEHASQEQRPAGAEQAGAAQLHLLQLGLEEAFFLAHVLSCCSVHQQRQPGEQQQHPGEQQQPTEQQQQPRAPALSPAALWAWCCAAAPGGRSGFAACCASYQHFRAKGWLPRPGLSFGADWVLYKLHPELSHSDYVVSLIVEQQQAPAARNAGGPGGQQQGAANGSCSSGGAGGGGEMMSSDGGEVVRRLSWLDAQMMQRLARQVLKERLLLYVRLPPDAQLGDPACLGALAVREVLLSRWVPGEAREQ